MIWWIFPAALGFFGLVILFSGLGRIGSKKVATGSFRFLTGGLILGGAGLLGLVGLNLQTYSRLAQERPVATVDLVYLGPQLFRASVTLDGEVEPTTYEVRGDEIEFKARVIRWNNWANIIGYDSIYKLDRMAGQYRSIDEDLSKPRTVYPLSNDPGLDVFQVVQKRGGWVKAVNAYYGSGTYVPMLAGARYEIFMTQNGLLARAGNDIARDGLKNWRPPEGSPLVGTPQPGSGG